MSLLRRPSQEGIQPEMTNLRELSVSPLVDLSFLLLIIFLVMAPFLGGSSSSNDVSDPAKTQLLPAHLKLISLTQDGTIHFQGKQLDRLELRDALIKLHRAHPDTSMVIETPEKAQAGQLIAIINLVQSIGISRLGVVQSKPENL